MNKLNCIIADDEPMARSVMENYIQQHPHLTIGAVCKDAFEVQEALTKGHYDLLFLDINMPQVSGISLLRSLIHPPLVVFTTAYPEYAVEGFELNAVDYLLKPFSFERFMKAVNRAMNQTASSAPEINTGQQIIFFKSDKKLHKVNLSDIRYMESIGDYVKLTGAGETLILNETLKELQEQLPANMFIRVHKSWIISLKFVDFVEGNYVRAGNKDIPIGATYKEGFLQRLQEQNKKGR